MTVDIRDLITHSTKKSGKCPKTLREDGSRSLRGCNMESQTRRKGVVTLNDAEELDDAENLGVNKDHGVHQSVH